MAGYVYEPLPPIPEIGLIPPFSRILLLSSGSGHDPLSGHLYLLNVELPGSGYEALSYTWGNDPPSNCLWIGPSPLPIRPNLEAALTNLRLPDQHRLLWVDAVCIDQSNLDERSRQVQYMRFMFKHAVRVIVWVGLKTPGVEIAFEAAGKIAHFMKVAKERQQQQSLDGNNAASSNAKNTHLELSEILMSIPLDWIQCVAKLLDRPYFLRCWCIQEVVTCSWALLKSEELEMDLMDLLACMFVVSNSEERMQSNNAFHIRFQVYDQRQPQPSTAPKVQGSLGKFLNLLYMSRGLQATDKRDKIFSQLGISDESLDPVLALTEVMGNEPRMLEIFRKGFNRFVDGMNSLGPNIDVIRSQALEPNYRQSTVDVNTELTRFMMRKSPRTLEVLDHVAHTTDREKDEYPSWVPKWYEPYSNHVMSGTNLAGFCDGHFRYFAEVRDNSLLGVVRPRVLAVDGFMVDTVTATTESFSLRESDLAFTIANMESAWLQLFACPLSPRQEMRY